MIERIWNSILDFTSKLVIPDWGSLIALLPVILLVVVGLWLLLTVRRFATAGPTRRGKSRITPRTPHGIHMPGPSFAPVFAAIGAFLLFFGLVIGGLALLLGVAALVLTLLYWGREGLADFDHHGVTVAEPLPEVVHEGPPPGVHMPGPSFRPILASIAVATLFFGLVFGGWILIVGIAFVITTLLGWLHDARGEFVKTVEADRTGHLENLPDPAWPRRLMWVFAILIAFAVVVDQGILPPRTNTAAGGPGASGAPPSGAPGGVPSAAAGDLTLVAEGIKFDTAELKAPAGKEFTVAFDNKDQGVPHDFALRNDSGLVFKGETVTGPGQTLDKVPPLQPGSYTFFCTFHANMTGTLTAG